MSPQKTAPVPVDELRGEVQNEYTDVARDPAGDYHFHTGRSLAVEMLDYPGEMIDSLPDSVVESFAGTGNPFLAGHLESGERVVDVGCGTGMDSFIAAKIVGSSGHVIGVDMTPAMLKKARRAADQLDLDQVEFRDGYAEDLPIQDDWADRIISNGVINLCPDKETTFEEFGRVLKEGGSIQIGDILNHKPVPDEAKCNIDLWTG
ncbi:MAG: methyltransferase domain-containing protein [bacterium]